MKITFERKSDYWTCVITGPHNFQASSFFPTLEENIQFAKMVVENFDKKGPTGVVAYLEKDMRKANGA